MVDCAPPFKLVRPRRIRKYSLDTHCYLELRLSFANRLQPDADPNLVSPLRQILRHVIQNLSAVWAVLFPIRALRAASTALRMSFRFPRALPRAVHLSRREPPCCSPNPVAPVFRRCRALLCGRSPVSRVPRSSGSPQQPFRRPATLGADLNHAGSRYSINPSLPPSRPYPLSR